MKPDRWQQVEQLYHLALERQPSQRVAFLQEACRGDEVLLREVESLLTAREEGAGFLNKPAIQEVAQLLTEDQAHSLVGRQLGSYSVLSLLGSGGMGQVYRARDAKLGRDVAIKVLPREFSSDRERVRRFEQEARAASALNHPNIITIHEIGQVDSMPYMVMELVEGKTLREVLAAAPLPTKRILQLAAQVADGLAKAHAAGITHRDLKPENLMLTKDGLVKILDFGLAKQTRLRSGGEEGSQIATEGTEPGLLLGTVGYMSPEQAQGHGVNFQSDQFSFGAILYEMVTGERAFASGSAAETLSAIIREDPKSIVELSPKTPTPLRWIVERCLAKDPEERYASTRDLARELQVLRDRFSEVDRPEAVELPGAASSAVTRRLLLPAVIGLAVAGFALLTGTYFLSRWNREPSARIRQLTFRHGNITGARFAADGQTVIYGATSSGKPGLYTTHPESPESGSVGLRDAGIFSISSSGEMAIALGCNMHWGECIGTLARVPSAGGAPREIMENVSYADWAPDGKGLAMVSIRGEEYHLEYPIGKLLYKTSGWITYVRFSPKGDLIAFLDHPILEDLSGSVCVVDLTGKKRVLSAEWGALQGLAWSPTGDEVWFTGWKQDEAGIQAVTLAGQKRLVFPSPGVTKIMDVSRDGKRVLVMRGTPRGWVMGLPPGAPKERDLSWFDFSTAADLSADGKTLLFSEHGAGARGGRRAYLRKTDGSDAVWLGAGKPLALSPDTKWALVLQETSPPQLILLPTGPGEQKPLPRGAISEYSFAGWFPDGRQIFFSGVEAGHRPRTYVQDINGGNPRPVTAEGMEGGLLSPDGKLIAAFDRYGEFYLCPVEGGDARGIEGFLEGDKLIEWSGDGRSLFLREVRGPNDLVLKIYKLDLASGRREFWRELAPPDPAVLIDIGTAAGQVRLTPDGKSYVYTYWTFPSELYMVEGLK